jgi:hypothetical protein
MGKVSSAAVICGGNITACSKMNFLSIKILAIINFCISAFLSESFRDFDKQNSLSSIGYD